MVANFLLLNGPNLNLLGTREPKIYGSTTLHEIELRAIKQAKTANANMVVFQSNYEGALVERIHVAKITNISAIIINPGSLTHTSVALRDAFTGVAIPFIEVHISNIYQREEFRHFSYLSSIAKAVLCGFGIDGYRLAIDYLLQQL